MATIDPQGKIQKVRGGGGGGPDQPFEVIFCVYTCSSRTHHNIS